VIVHRLERSPLTDLAQKLEAFERAFRYALGPAQSFRISHGPDYHRFFRAMGRAACFVAEEDGAVLGTVAVAIRRLGRPDGSVHAVAYVGDLKVAERVRGGRTLLRLAAAAQGWARGRTDAAFGVVMAGTAVSPAAYTGRLGIPACRELGQVVVLRFATCSNAVDRPRTGEEDETIVAAERCARYGLLSRGRYWTRGGAPRTRSRMAPVWLVRRDGRACGRLEDTLRAKRLTLDDGSELVSAHLSAFACEEPAAGASVIREACRRAARLGYSGLFVAVAPCDYAALCRAMPEANVTAAAATVYGAGLEAGCDWNINTAEI